MLGLVQSVLSCLWCDHVWVGRRGQRGQVWGKQRRLEYADLSCVAADGRAPCAHLLTMTAAPAVPGRGWCRCLCQGHALGVWPDAGWAPCARSGSV